MLPSTPSVPTFCVYWASLLVLSALVSNEGALGVKQLVRMPAEQAAEVDPLANISALSICKGGIRLRGLSLAPACRADGLNFVNLSLCSAMSSNGYVERAEWLGSESSTSGRPKWPMCYGQCQDQSLFRPTSKCFKTQAILSALHIW